MRDRVWLGFNVGIESDFVFVRGIEIARVQAEINLISVWWSIDLFFCVWWRLKLTRVLDAGRESHGFSVSIEMTWFLSGWLILTRFRCGRSNMTLVQFRDQNWFVSCMGVESDLVLVSWSKLTWILCHDIRPQTGKFLTDRYVCYVLEDHTQSPLTEKLSGLSCINEQKRCLWAQIALPPTFSGVDQAPDQRLVFPLCGPFSSSRAFFYSGTLQFRVSGGLIYLPFFYPRKSGKTTSVGMGTRTSFVRSWRIHHGVTQ